MTAYSKSLYLNNKQCEPGYSNAKMDSPPVHDENNNAIKNNVIQLCAREFYLGMF